MATADQIKSLVKAYVNQDDDKFKTVVLQIAAHEAKLGHDNIARELKLQMDKVGTKKASIIKLNAQNPMLLYSVPTVELSELVVSDEIDEKIRKILMEYRNRVKLNSFGLMNRRKILIEGKPGTGKTMTASVIASELTLPLYTVQVDKLVTKFMGETSARLRQIFDNMEIQQGIYLFDEFDAIGADRSLDNEVGEMRRILNSFLQFIEQDSSDSIIIAATNNQKMLDQALFRRFDDVLHYDLPGQSEINRLIKKKIETYDSNYKVSQRLLEVALGLSQAEISRACDDAIKISILDDCDISESTLMSLLQERHDIYASKEA